VLPLSVITQPVAPLFVDGVAACGVDGVDPLLLELPLLIPLLVVPPNARLVAAELLLVLALPPTTAT